MAIEVNASQAICSKCGRAYSRRKGYFPVSYAVLHKGLGYVPVCKECIDDMYNGYLSQCNNSKDAVRQVCRKLDLYWNDNVYELVERKSTTRSMMTQYIAKINSITYAGKSYDDTLSDEGTLWSFCQNNKLPEITDAKENTDNETPEESIELHDIPDDVKSFWGSGYTPSMYTELEQRRSYWMSRFPKDIELDIGTEAIIRQICSLELDINRDRMVGRAVDKSINALNTLLGSANLKPTQKKDDTDSSIENTTFGEWIRRWENQRPIPEPDPELKDVDGIVRYISIWFLGHLCKMLGIKNTYCKLYEDELAKMRVERPEYEDEDDEEFFNNSFGVSTYDEE